jgi:serine phosphatase RsbU (regulator of sigma subunit)
MKILKTLKITCFIVVFTISQFTNAQEGSPFQTNFIPDDESLTENYSICNDKDGVLIIANRKGILTFDAEDWKLIQTPELPIVVSFDPKSQIVFVGCRNSLGYLNKNYFGDYEYIKLSDNQVGAIIQIAYAGNYVYFMSPTYITRINTKNFKDILQWKASEKTPFQTLIPLKNQVLVDIAGIGLESTDDKVLKPFLNDFSLSGKVLFALNYDESSVLLGATDNKCYLFNGVTVKPFILQDQQYISDGSIVDAKNLDNDKIVISTVGAGCLVFDRKTGKTVFTANYQTGLPDDEIFALATDKNHGVWLAHSYGLTRIDAGIPVKNFSYYKGLSGNLQSIEFLNGKLFIGSSNGVYYLDKKKDYVEYTIKEPQKTETSALPAKKTEQHDVSKEVSKSEQAQPKEQKRGFFGRLFSRKSKNDETVAKEEEKSTGSEEESAPKTSIWNILGVNKAKESQSERQDLQHKVYKISSITHVYNKIPNFEHKCKQLLLFNGKLIAVSVVGIYEINEFKATLMLPNVEVNYIYAEPQTNTLYLCTKTGVLKETINKGKWNETEFPGLKKEPVYSFARDIFENYWIGAESKTYRIKLKKDGSLKESKTFLFNVDSRERVIVRIINKKPAFFLSSGIYSIFNDSVQMNLPLSHYVGTNTKYFFPQQDNTFIRNGQDWISLSASNGIDSIVPTYLNLFDKINTIYKDNTSNLWLINDNSTIYKVDQKGIEHYSSDFNAFIKHFSGASNVPFSLYGVELDKKNHQVKIYISAPFYVRPNSNQFQYKIGDQEWSEWSSQPYFGIYLANSGKYEIHVRAKNIFGKISEEKILRFSIKKPFYETFWFYLLCVIALVYLIYLFIKFRERNLLHEKEVLEQKVKERTKQIEEQKEEIEAQRDNLAEKNEQILIQKEAIIIQSDKIALQNREIKDSIRYAKRLQTAVLPDNDIISSLLSDYFVLFKPKDIVSGDFYWVNSKNDKVIAVAADCTGHGVPGGFLSMLGVSLLNEISAIDKDFKANEILNLLRVRLKSTLIKEGHDQNETKDGMDIALVIIDKKQMKVQYAGANNPLYLIRNKEIIEYNADKMPVGSFIAEKESFTNNEIDIQHDDQLFMFSDGFRDQLGGPNEKRIKSPGLRKLLLEVNENPMRKQKELIDKFFEDWKGDYEQVDDILIFGIKI